MSEVTNVKEVKEVKEQERVFFCRGMHIGGRYNDFCLQAPKYFIDANTAYCTTHAKMENRRRLRCGEPLIVLKPSTIKTKKPEFKHLIDEKASQPTQCCIRIRPNEPLCAQRVAFQIHNMYFCRLHTRKHPERKDAVAVKPKSKHDLPPTFVDQIDQKCNNPYQCCIRMVRDNTLNVLCTKSVVYRIRNKYFCSQHGRQHPHASESQYISEHGKHGQEMQQLTNEMQRIRTMVERVDTRLDYLFQQKEFREFVYELAESIPNREPTTNLCSEMRNQTKEPESLG